MKTVRTIAILYLLTTISCSQNNSKVNIKKDGEDIAYYKTGELLGKCTYKNGKINGEVTEYNKNGTLMFKGNQVDGELVGKAMHYYKNGKPKTEYFYKDNKIFLVNYWDSLGVQQIINGEGEKIFEDFLTRDKNGKDTTIYVTTHGLCKDSNYFGTWKYYDRKSGILILEREFEKDKIITERWQ